MSEVGSGSMVFERLPSQQIVARGTKLNDGRLRIPAEAFTITGDYEPEEDDEDTEEDGASHDGQTSFTLAFAGIRRATLVDILYSLNMYRLERETMIEALGRITCFPGLFGEQYLSECGLDVSRNLYLPRQYERMTCCRFNGRGGKIFNAIWSLNFEVVTNENNSDQATS